MSIRGILDNIRNRLNSSPIETTLELRQYFQWYEDTERLQLEQEEMQNEFPEFKCYKLSDARVCFTGKMVNCEVAFICGYNYPKEPAETSLISGDVPSSKFISPDGLIDVFGSGDIEWDANTTFVVDIAKKVRSMLELLSSIQQDDYSEEKADELNK